jgi:hypothetical protein
MQLLRVRIVRVPLVKVSICALTLRTQGCRTTARHCLLGELLYPVLDNEVFALSSVSAKDRIARGKQTAKVSRVNGGTRFEPLTLLLDPYEFREPVSAGCGGMVIAMCA